MTTPAESAQFAGKVAVVTGAGSGIGTAISTLLAARGAVVVATDLDQAAAMRVAERISGFSQQLDVTNAAAVDDAARSIDAQHGGIDIWCSNAGVSSMARFIEITEDEYDWNLSVNLKGIFLCGQAAARVMIPRGGGVIVNTASMAGKRGFVPYLAHYIASKFGVIGLTQAMAAELAPQRIRVNCVCPGFVATPMLERELEWEAELSGVAPADIKQLWVSETPMGRLEEPEDVARAVAFLAGDDAGFITGEALAVNGGAFMD